MHPHSSTASRRAPTVGCGRFFYRRLASLDVACNRPTLRLFSEMDEKGPDWCLLNRSELLARFYRAQGTPPMFPSLLMMFLDASIRLGFVNKNFVASTPTGGNLPHIAK